MSILWFVDHIIIVYIHCQPVNVIVNVSMIMNALNIMPHLMWLYIFYLTRGNKDILIDWLIDEVKHIFSSTMLVNSIHLSVA